MTEAEKTAVLCYVENSWAFFTTRRLVDQWGDDWDDVPYESNAGRPYEWHSESSDEPWEIIKVAWDGPFNTPDYMHHNSPWSVQSINAGAVAWLNTARWVHKHPVSIPAGVTLEEFQRLINKGGGRVYLAAPTPSGA